MLPYLVSLPSYLFLGYFYPWIYVHLHLSCPLLTPLSSDLLRLFYWSYILLRVLSGFPEIFLSPEFTVNKFYCHTMPARLENKNLLYPSISYLSTAK